MTDNIVASVLAKNKLHVHCVYPVKLGAMMFCPYQQSKEVPIPNYCMYMYYIIIIL